MTAQAGTVQEAALRYAARGMHVFPCNGKAPLTARGLHDATTDRATIERWWAEWPDANVAIRTGSVSRLVVLDVDGKEGHESLRDLEHVHGALPTTASVKTPRDGAHYYLRHPGGEIRNSAGQLGAGLDVRGDGGYVVAPPSHGPNGRRYEPDEQAPVAEAPAWFIDALRANNGRRNGSAPPIGDEIPEGKRNATLASMAGSMRRRGADESEILAALNRMNERRCRPPLPSQEVEAIAASIAHYPPHQEFVQSVPRQKGGAAQATYAVTWTDTKPPKLLLPDVPAPDDLAGHCAWLTSVLRLDPPVTGAVHQGLRGPEGHVEIRRAGAPPIRFEPAAAVSTARRLLPILGWQLQPTDGEPYGFKDEHARRIAHVLRLLCGAAKDADEAQETGAIIGTFTFGAVPVERHTTHGTSAQRYEAATALQRDADDTTGRPIGPPRYLIDENTGELAIRVSDLQEAARRHVGSSLPRGWLDARMDGLGWERIRLDGHALSGRSGRSGPHARTDVYRGHMPADEEQAVTT